MTVTDPSAPLDLLVVGGGVMGLFTAYHASGAGHRVTVLERGTIGDPMTASFGRTRSYRRDYLDPLYVTLADEAMRVWSEFERATGTEVLVRCGCMNIATAAVTPELDKTYAQLSTDVMVELDLAPEVVDPAAIASRFPYLTADLAHLDPEAGLVDLRTVTATLTRVLAERGVDVREGVEVTALYEDGDHVVAESDAGTFRAGAVVVTAGHGTNDVLALLPGESLHVPLSRDRPSEAKYFDPPADRRHLFTSDVMPVIAYLDTGVYVHPIVEGVVDHVKVGYYNPPDIPRDRTGVNDIADFVAQCMPGLADATFEDVEDTDGCDYDLVADDDFVMGAVPGHPRVFVGVGWRGTGYKYSPWVGRTMAELALHDGTTDDISRFDPARFQEASR